MFKLRDTHVLGATVISRDSRSLLPGNGVTCKKGDGFSTHVMHIEPFPKPGAWPREMKIEEKQQKQETYRPTV